MAAQARVRMERALRETAASSFDEAGAPVDSLRSSITETRMARTTRVEAAIRTRSRVFTVSVPEQLGVSGDIATARRKEAAQLLSRLGLCGGRVGGVKRLGPVH